MCLQFLLLTTVCQPYHAEYNNKRAHIPIYCLWSYCSHSMSLPPILHALIFGCGAFSVQWSLHTIFLAFISFQLSGFLEQRFHYLCCMLSFCSLFITVFGTPTLILLPHKKGFARKGPLDFAANHFLKFALHTVSLFGFYDEWIVFVSSDHLDASFKTLWTAFLT